MKIKNKIMVALLSSVLLSLSAGATEGKWKYYEKEDDFEKKVMKFYEIESLNYFNLSFPYSGKQNLDLILREINGDFDVLLAIDKGQILCRPSSCKVDIIFDDGSVETYKLAESNSGSSEVVFITDTKRFMTKVIKSKKMKVKLEFFQNGSIVSEFDLSGFDKSKLNYTSKIKGK